METSKREFLMALEPLTHRERMGRLVNLGRRVSQGDEVAAHITRELGESPESYERRLALMTVFGSRDGARVVTSLSDVSRTLRRGACRMLPIFCDDAQVAQGLEAIIERRVLLRTLGALVRRKRQVVVDSFLQARTQRGCEARGIDMLPLASQQYVESHMELLVEAGGPRAWARLAARHPSFLTDWLLKDLKGGGAIDARQRYRLMAVLETLAGRAPDPCIQLMKLLMDFGEQPRDLQEPLRKLVRSRPGETFDLLKARHESGQPAHPPGAFGVVCFDRGVRALGPERLDYLIRYAWGTLGDRKRGLRWFLRLEPDHQRAVLRAFIGAGRGGWGAFLFRYMKAESEAEVAARDRAFERFSRAAQSSSGVIAPSVLDWLPRDLREREARRHLESCEFLVSKPEQRIVYARLLSLAEAKTVLAPFLGHPEGEKRALALRTLIGSVRHDRESLSEAIAYLKERKFEQDPVRSSGFEALLGLRRSQFKLEHLSPLGEVIQDGLDAADLSTRSSSVIERLVVQLFRVDGEWGAKWLVRLLAVRGYVSTWGLGTDLTAPEARTLGPVLAKLAELWASGALAAVSGRCGSRRLRARPVLLSTVTVVVSHAAASHRKASLDSRASLNGKRRGPRLWRPCNTPWVAQRVPRRSWLGRGSRG